MKWHAKADSHAFHVENPGSGKKFFLVPDFLLSALFIHSFDVWPFLEKHSILKCSGIGTARLLGKRFHPTVKKSPDFHQTVHFTGPFCRLLQNLFQNPHYSRSVPEFLLYTAFLLSHTVELNSAVSFVWERLHRNGKNMRCHLNSFRLTKHKRKNMIKFTQLQDLTVYWKQASDIYF